jgi:hypothetical protein
MVYGFESEDCVVYIRGNANASSLKRVVSVVIAPENAMDNGQCLIFIQKTQPIT